MHVITRPARKGSNSIEKVLRGSKSKSKMVEKRTGRGTRAWTFGLDFWLGLSSPSHRGRDCPSCSNHRYSQDWSTLPSPNDETRQ
jgi:hypothetical protein